ncbi:helix-turn-helix transcriptional regulator [Streptomyces sp. NPDC052000]|uniref:helix-turn-helix transcriptional regulator n=1 Tax=Streptomyces sp. NPDC052000 TaxID=3155676 RepID=UPI0034507808
MAALTRSSESGRRTLGAFVRSRRERLSPDDVGISDSSRRRTPGLRREEVAALSGVSLSWYTWLEQGRDIKVSRQVLASLSRALRLSAPEIRHLYRLGDELPPDVGDPRGCPERDEQLDAMLRALEPNPAVLLDHHWDVIAWNRAEAGLFTDFAALPVERRNMLWVIFAWPPARFLMTDWEAQAGQVLAQFRMRADEEPGDPRFAAVVADLLAAAPDFARFWQRHEVADYRAVNKHFTHPRAGRLTLRQSKLIAADDPRLRLLARFPADERTKDALALLVEE